MCTASLWGGKRMFFGSQAAGFPFNLYKTELATAKHGKGAAAGTSKQPLISGNHNYRADSTS